MLEMSSGVGPSAGPPVALAPLWGKSAPVQAVEAISEPPPPKWTAKQKQDLGEAKLMEAAAKLTQEEKEEEEDEEEEEKFRRHLAHQAGAAVTDLHGAMAVAAKKAATAAVHHAMMEHIQTAARLLDEEVNEVCASLLASGPTAPLETPQLSEDEKEEIHKATEWRRWMQRVLRSTEAQVLPGMHGERRKRFSSVSLSACLVRSDSPWPATPKESSSPCLGCFGAGLNWSAS